MNTTCDLDKKRQDILKQMATIRSMLPAALSEQMLPVLHKGNKEPVMRGPYYVLSRWENGKNRSRRVKKVELEQVKADVANYKRFIALCEDFVDLTRRLGDAERQATAEQGAVKKGLKSRSKRTPKSSASSM